MDQKERYNQRLFDPLPATCLPSGEEGFKWLKKKDIIKGFSILCPPQLLRLNLAFMAKCNQHRNCL